MKKLLAVALLALVCAAIAPAQEQADIGMFYSSLGSQGEWISMEGGAYAWRPSGVDPGWRPYTDGRWVWTDDGWYWASDEPWAWATYHYGRWFCDDYYGWVWVPGYEWAPAWVEWRDGENCVGWAPLSPYAVFSVNWGVHYRRYWATPYSYWSFVDCRYMGARDLHRYVYPAGENTRFIGRTRTSGSVRYDNGRIITRGPGRDFVEQRGNIRIPHAELVDVQERGRAGVVREGGADRIGVYRPRFDAGARGDEVARPDRVRANDHPLGLDTRGTDLRRTEDVRLPRQTVQPGNESRRNVESQQRPAPVYRSQRAPDRQWNQPRPAVPGNRLQQSYNVPRTRTWSPQPQRGAAPQARTWSPPPQRGSGPAGRTESPKVDRGGCGRGGRR